MKRFGVGIPGKLMLSTVDSGRIRRQRIGYYWVVSFFLSLSHVSIFPIIGIEIFNFSILKKCYSIVKGMSAWE